MFMKNYYSHPSSFISKSASIGHSTKIWHLTQIMNNVKIGHHCIIGKNVYLDSGVTIGNYCKIQNNVSIYHGSVIGNKVFIGPHVVFTNDRYPRATTKEGVLKTANDWHVDHIIIKDGVSIGACSVILPGVIVNQFAMIGAGSVVVDNVKEFNLVFGNPAKIRGKVNKEGKTVSKKF